MLKSVFKSIRGVVCLSLYAINIVLCALLVLLGGLVVWIVPWSKWHHHGLKYLLKIPVWWMDGNRLIAMLHTHSKWVTQGKGDLNPRGWYILVANHRSWIDILVLGIYFNRKIPILKFFMKKELLWTLPVAGLACYILGYPFMARPKREDLRKRPELRTKDILTAKKACKKFKQYPTTVVNFVEGTRFSLLKREQQASPYQNLLKPKSTGMALVLNELGDQLDGIIDVTIKYSQPKLSLWQFACGDFEYIYLQYEVLPVRADLLGDCYEDRVFRKHFQQWLNDLWQQKDKNLETLPS